LRVARVRHLAAVLRPLAGTQLSEHAHRAGGTNGPCDGACRLPGALGNDREALGLPLVCPSGLGSEVGPMLAHQAEALSLCRTEVIEGFDGHGLEHGHDPGGLRHLWTAPRAGQEAASCTILLASSITVSGSQD